MNLTMKPKPSDGKNQTGSGRAKPAAKSPSAKTTRKKSGIASSPRQSKPRATNANTRSSPSAQESNRPALATNEILRAGLGALSLKRAESAVADSFSKFADSFAIKKLEEVFDHRVAATLERMGYPSAAEIGKLVEQVADLSKLIQSQKKTVRK